MRVLEHGNSTQERRKFYFSFLARGGNFFFFFKTIFLNFKRKFFFKAWNKSRYECICGGTYLPCIE